MQRKIVKTLSGSSPKTVAPLQKRPIQQHYSQPVSISCDSPFKEADKFSDDSYQDMGKS
jgi:hypothetical protein